MTNEPVDGIAAVIDAIRRARDGRPDPDSSKVLAEWRAKAPARPPAVAMDNCNIKNCTVDRDRPPR